MRYLRELSDELAAVGIRGGRRNRILAEVEDHLQESGGDFDAFGEPALVAERFADELATGATRRAGFVTFAALVPAGLGYAILFVFGDPSPDVASGRTPALGLLAAALIVLAPQLAFAGGLLTLLRAWRLRHDDVAPAAEVRVLRRRAAFAVGAGATALGSVVLYALEFSAALSSFWIVLASVTSAVGVVPLVLAGIAVGRTARLQPGRSGVARDVFADLEPVVGRMPPGLRGHPWGLCFVVATSAAVAAAVAGGPDKGLRNAVVEFAAVSIGFAALSRFLGLRV